MKFRNYCAVIVGDRKNSIAEIEKISETKINKLDGKGLLILTFSSNFEPSELTDLLKSNDINFLVFDLNSSNSGFNINNPKIEEGLFGFLKKINLDEKAKDFLNTIAEAKTIVEEVIVKTKINKEGLSESDIIKMNNKEKKEIFDKILDKGVENITENDKKIIPFLVK